MSAVTVLAPRPTALASREMARALARDAMLKAMGVVALSAARQQSLELALSSTVTEAERISVRAAVGSITRAAQNPATTTDPEWAGLLAWPAVQAFTDLWSDAGSVTATAPMRRMAFDGKNLKIPRRTSRGAPDLAAHWHREGEAIRIGAMVLGSQVLSPATMTILCTSTREMLMASGGTLDDVVRSGIVADSAKVLEATMWSTAAASGPVPAGIGNVLPANSAVSSGATAADISADLIARLAQMVASGYGARPFIAASTINAMVLANLFPQSAPGTVLNIPIVSGPDMPEDLVFLVDGNATIFAADPPLLEVSESALVHEEGDAALAQEDVMVGTPARSLWQTNALSWHGVFVANWWAPPGAVQVLTGVAWVA